MKSAVQTLATLMLAFTVMLAITGCTPDPAKDKEAAEVHEAVEVPEAGSPDAAPAVEGTKYVIDTESSQISFTGSKVTGTHSGGWSKYTCEVIVPEGDFTKAQITLDIDMTSTYSDDKDLTDTLNSEKMFDVATYPTAKFVSTSIEGADGEYKVSGNLTLHGVTKNVTFTTDVELDEESITAEAEFSINRKDFDVNYDGLADDAIRENVLMLFYVEGSAVE